MEGRYEGQSPVPVVCWCSGGLSESTTQESIVHQWSRLTSLAKITNTKAPEQKRNERLTSFSKGRLNLLLEPDRQPSPP